MKEMKTLTIGDVQYVIVDGSVGSLEGLRTTIKTSIVAAINELVSNQDSINEEDLSAAVNAALEEAKKNGEFDGPAGDQGPKGDTGVGILSVVQSTTSTADDGNNVITVTLTNGDTFTFTVQNGSKGSSGTNGKDGVDGKNGVDGEDGFSPIATVTKTADGATLSITDKNGTTTATIANGKDGKTPVRGTDYWTPADQEAIVQQVITALGTPVFGRVDADNNIILTGELADGTYTVKYEDGEGNATEIGTLNHAVVPETAYTNLADPTSADWLVGQRLNSSGEVKTAQTAHVTNFIPVQKDDIVRVRGLHILYYDSGLAHCTVHFYDASKVRAGSIGSGANPSYFVADTSDLANATDFVYTIGSGPVTMVSGDGSNIAYVRFSGMLCPGYTADDVIITVNQEITESAPESSYTNLLPLSINADGTLYNAGQGWKANTRLNSSGAEAERADMEVTGFIPAKYGDILRMRNVTFNYFQENSDYRDNFYLSFYDSAFSFLGYRKVFSTEIDTGTKDIVIDDAMQSDIGLSNYNGSNASNVAYIRISSSDISDDSVITINQEITE